LTNGTDSTSATTARDRIDWFGTARGRLGYSFGSVVLYGTGGLAFGGVSSQFQNNIAINGIGGQANAARSGDSTAVGWAAGAGFEWMFAPHWSFKTEYLHVDLGSTDLATASAQTINSGTYRFSHAFDSARLGINYHFSGY
jgi:outer membrane immunogenic protein